MRCSGHRRRGVHRLESGRRAARARRRGDGRRRPLDRAPRQPRRARWRPGAELVELDIRDGDGAEPRWPRERRPETVFHLAAQIDVRKSLEDPAFDAAINVGGTANVLEAARAGERGRVVFVSTGGAIYGEGEGQQLPLDEDAPIAPLSAYGQSKFAAEGYLALYERLYGLSGDRAAARQRLRPAPGPARRGRRDRDLLRPAARRRAADRLRRRHPDPRLHICGRRGRGGAGRRRHRDATGPVNIGTGRETSVLELVEALRPSSAARETSSPSSRRRGPARCSGSRSTPAAPNASWAGGRRPTSTRACASPSTPCEPGH